MIKELKKIGFWSYLFIGAIAFTFTSCDSEPDVIDIEELSDASIERLQNGVVGKNFCLEFVFPVTIQFVDESTAEVNSYENLHETVSAWFEENEVEKNRENKPQLVFPIQVVNMDGEVVDVESREALRELKSDCPKRGEGKGRKGKGFKCFSLVYPITITLDGVDTSFEDRMSLKAAIRAYKQEVGDEAEKPTLVFPITVELDDDTQVEVASQEELEALKDECLEEEG